jgi:hypothetical protein
MKGGESPSLVLALHRFTLGQVAANGNVVVIVAEGGYDTVVVVQYRQGRPEVVFSDSTHSQISISSSSEKVTVSLGTVGEKDFSTEVFVVDDEALGR